jgi:hypothetical protein
VDLADLVPAGHAVKRVERVAAMGRSYGVAARSWVAAMGRSHGRVVIHFFAIGAALFALQQLTDHGRALGFGRETIVVRAGEVRELRAEWARETRSAPDAQATQALVRAHADEEMLHREALRLGLDRSDPVVRRRLAQNMRFVRPGATADDAALVAEALALGMSRRDPVVRRRLVDAMHERMVAGLGVDEDEVRAYVAANPQRYAAQPRVRFAHVYLSADAHADLQAAARKVSAQLAGPPQPGATPAGDPFLLGSEFDATLAEVERQFGRELASQLAAAPLATWQGPVPSPYGLHYVWVNGREGERASADAALLRRARYALLAEREAAHVRVELERLRRHYPVQVEEDAVAVAALP